MRSRPVDQGPTITFGGYGTGSPSGGSGVSNGVAWTYTKLAAGVFQVRFDAGLIPQSVTATTDASAGTYWARSGGMTPGALQVTTGVVSGSPSNSDAPFHFVCAALDKRPTR